MIQDYMIFQFKEMAAPSTLRLNSLDCPPEFKASRFLILLCLDWAACRGWNPAAYCCENNYVQRKTKTFLDICRMPVNVYIILYVVDFGKVHFSLKLIEQFLCDITRQVTWDDGLFNQNTQKIKEFKINKYIDNHIWSIKAPLLFSSVVHSNGENVE